MEKDLSQAKLESQPQDTVKEEDRIPLKEKLAYGVGALMDGGGVALMSCVMLKYMTDGLAIGAAAASTIIMASKFWDAITDPLMGNISDNTRSKYGRRKPYMFFGGILLFLAVGMLFLPINRFIPTDAGKIAFMAVMYIFYNTCSTITQVPYCSLASDISKSYKERNKANTVKLVFTAASSGLSYVIPLLAIESYISGKITDIQYWLFIFLIFGTLFGAGLIICSRFVKERVTVPKDEPKRKFDVKEYLVPFKIKSFVWHIVMYASAFMCMDIISALAVYYATDVWAGVTLFGMNFSSMFIIAPLMVTAVLAFPLARYLMDKKSKQFAFRVGLPCYIVGGIMLAIMSPAWTPAWLVPIVAGLMGFGFGGAQMMPWIIFPDTIDVAELKLGYRPTGAFSGAMTLIRKTAGALGVGMVGWIIDGFGYIPKLAGETVVQSETVLLSIRLMMGIGIASLMSVALVASLMYKVTNRKLDRIRFLVDKENTEGIDKFTLDEKQEKFDLIKELAGYGKEEKKQAKQDLGLAE